MITLMVVADVVFLLGLLVRAWYREGSRQVDVALKSVLGSPSRTKGQEARRG